jgi:hypothetical protein
MFSFFFSSVFCFWGNVLCACVVPTDKLFENFDQNYSFKYFFFSVISLSKFSHFFTKKFWEKICDQKA